MSSPIRRLPLASDSPRTYQRMLSGRLLHLLDPSPLDVEISDFVIGISRESRWNGQTRGDHLYSVAQHSLLVLDILDRMVWPTAPRAARLHALTHDLAETVLKDLVTPVKHAVGDQGYRELGDRLDRAIRIRIGLPVELPDRWKKAVKKADRIAAVTEAVRLARWTEADARRDVGAGYRGPLWEEALEPWPESVTRERWMAAFAALTADGGGGA